MGLFNQKQEAEERKSRGQLPSDSNKNSKKRKRENEPKKEGVLGALGDYGSEDDSDGSDDDQSEKKQRNDDDEDVDMERDAISSKDPSSMGKIALPEKPHRAGPRCRAFMRGSCRFGNKCRYVHEKPQVKKQKKKKIYQEDCSG